jgi:hypothetical protein
MDLLRSGSGAELLCQAASRRPGSMRCWAARVYGAIAAANRPYLRDSRPHGR